MLLELYVEANILQYTRQLPQGRVVQSKMSTVLRLRNAALKIHKSFGQISASEQTSMCIVNFE